MTSTSSFFSRLRRIWPWAGLLVLAAMLTAPAYGQVKASAGFNPPRLAANQAGQYQIKLEDTGSGDRLEGGIPNIPGLRLSPSGTTNSFSFVNGVTTKSLTNNFMVQATAPGTYTIPEFTIKVNGQNVVVPAATLEVTPAATNAPDNASQQPGSAPGGLDLDLSAKVVRTTVYVGEKLPLDIVLTLRPDLRPTGIRGFNQIGDSFAQAKMEGDPAQDSTTIDGHTYRTLSWRTAITPLKAGPQKLNFEMSLVVSVPDRDPNDLLSRMMGGNPLAGIAFGREEEVKLKSTPLDFDVQALPEEGRPTNFTGGIGTFNADEPVLQAPSLQVGVPVTLKLTVSGKGNFDRFEAPVIDLGPQWRSYKPRETFKASDPSGYSGVKTFEYVLMPLSDKITELPAPQLNYFNPETKSYVELPLKPMPLSIQPAPPGQAPPPLPAVNGGTKMAATPGLVGPLLEPGSWIALPARPLFFSPWFWVAQAAPALLLASLVLTRRHQLRLETDPTYARRRRARRATRQDFERARAAANAGRAGEFYALAQRTLQEAASYSPQWVNDEAAEAMTWTEFDEHLARRGLPEATRAQAREIFEAGDALRFGGFSPNQATLAAAVAHLERLVQHLLSDS